MMENNADLKEERDKIIKGLEEAYRRFVELKKAKNSPLVVLKNGKISAVSPNEIPPTTVYKRKLD